MSLPSPSPSKKRKHADVPEKGNVTPHKKAKKDKDRSERKSKGKSKAADGQFQLINASVRVSIPPKFSADPLWGAKEMLDSLVMKYVPALQGVMLCHSNAHFVTNAALIKNECPFSICTVSFDATVWSPQIGMKLTGKINLCSPDHISLLVHRTFNVSIPREHIQTEHWAFEYGPAENDPEYGPHAAGNKENAESTPGNDTKEQDEPRGSWVYRTTGEKLGGEDGLLEFTVIGMTVANNMLSLKGSLQPDPFSPRHVPQPAVPAVRPEVEGDEEEDQEVNEILVNDQNGDGAQDEEDEIEEDPFVHLGQARDEALERQAAERQRAEEEKAREKEEKKRRKKERKERKEKEKALASVDGLPAPEASAASREDEKPPKKKRKKKSQGE